MQRRINFNAEWITKARDMRARGKSWAVTARVLGKTINQVRYALDERFRNKIIKSSRQKYARNRMMLEAAE